MLVVLLQTSSYCVLSRDLFKRLTDFSTRCLCFLSVQGSIGRFLEIWRNRASARRMGVAHSVLCSERVRRRSLLPRLRKDSVARLLERPRAGCARGRACGLSWPLSWQRLGNLRSACRVWFLASPKPDPREIRRRYTQLKQNTRYLLRIGRSNHYCLRTYLSGFSNLSTVPGCPTSQTST